MSRTDMLAALAADASLERADFLARAGRQLQDFIDANRERISDLGGITLIDEDPDFLSVAPDGTFRSRTRFLDEDAGEWVTETEVIENAAELVELYNPADVLAGFAEAAAGGNGRAAEEEGGPEAIRPVEPVMMPTPFDDAILGRSPYAGAADQWAATQPTIDEDDDDAAARALYDLALAFQERSQRVEGNLLDQFSAQAEPYARVLGSLMIVDDDDERLSLQSNGAFRAEVIPEDAPESWRSLESPDELVEYYDPTDVFGDLADALVEAYPAAIPQEGSGGGEGGGDDSELAD
jgi:hypothetical protein